MRIHFKILISIAVAILSANTSAYETKSCLVKKVDHHLPVELTTNSNGSYRSEDGRLWIYTFLKETTPNNFVTHQWKVRGTLTDFIKRQTLLGKRHYTYKALTLQKTGDVVLRVLDENHNEHEKIHLNISKEGNSFIITPYDKKYLSCKINTNEDVSNAQVNAKVETVPLALQDKTEASTHPISQTDHLEILVGGSYRDSVLSDLVNNGSSIIFSMPNDTIVWGQTISIVPSLESVYFSRDSSTVKNSIGIVNLGLGARPFFSLSQKLQFFGTAGLGVSSWRASSKQKSTEDVIINEGYDLSSVIEVGLSGLFSENFLFEKSSKWVLSAQYHYIYGSFGAGYSSFLMGLNIPVHWRNTL